MSLSDKLLVLGGILSLREFVCACLIIFTTFSKPAPERAVQWKQADVINKTDWRARRGLASLQLSGFQSSDACLMARTLQRCTGWPKKATC